jgi:ankyrin repeat protein
MQSIWIFLNKKSIPLASDYVINNNINELKILLNKNADVVNNRDEVGNCLLHLSICYQHFEIMKMLVEDYMADVNLIDIRGDSPLHVACFRGNVDFARYLLDHKADVSKRNLNGDTVLHCCIAGDFLDLACLLIEYGAERSARNSTGDTPLHYACRAGVRYRHLAVELVDDEHSLGIRNRVS